MSGESQMPSPGGRKSALSVSLRICCEKSDPVSFKMKPDKQVERKSM